MSEKEQHNFSHLQAPATTVLPRDARRRGHGQPGRSGPPGNANARRHGTYSLKDAVRTLGSRTIDRRTSVGKALAAWRSELLADLGGVESVSTQELALIEEAVKSKLILDSIDAWLLQQPSLIDKRKRCVLPAVRDRQALVSTLRGLLGDLGLKRRTRALPGLAEYLAAHTSSTADNGTQAPQRPTGGTAETATREVFSKSTADIPPDGSAKSDKREGAPEAQPPLVREPVPTELVREPVPTEGTP